jgi:hypothetical protein
VKALAALVGVLVVAGIAWLAVELATDEDVGERAEAIAEDPEEFLGQRVTVTGEVDSFFPGAFTLGDSTWGDELLVVPAEGVELPRVIRLRAATPEVRVTGVVRRKDDEVELVGGEEFEPYEGDGIVRAERIEVLD